MRLWLLGVAENVAGAAQDKGGSEKVPAVEASAIDELRILMQG